ncbi:MAG: hypothetical protein U5K71_03445 [Gracilimonas sp.]|nr:hypothetical protein [Gracilimonas sp.]
MDLSKRVAVSISFVASYDADPIIDIPNLTYELSNGFVIRFCTFDANKNITFSVLVVRYKKHQER